MLIFVTLFLPLLSMLTSCSASSESEIKIPQIPSHILKKIESQHPLMASSGGHATQEKQKIPMIGFDTTHTIQSTEELLNLYKEVYFLMATAMTPEEETSSWENRLFIKKQPKVWLSFSNSSKTEMFATPPSIALISMGPGGTLSLTSWNAKTQRRYKSSETSLRELFKDELASDDTKQES